MEESTLEKRLKLEGTTLLSLPNEIIYRIFKQLDENSLKTVSLVNKRFAEMIATSPVLLKNFKLSLSSNVWQSRYKLLEIFSLQRLIQHLEISNYPGNHEVLVKIFQKFGRNLKSLTLTESKIDDFTLREILKLLDSMESLTFTEIEVVKKLPAINPVGLRKLKNLAIFNCDWTIIKFITAQVRSLSLKSYFDEGKSKQDIVNFMTQQRKMEDLTLNGTSARTLFTTDEIIVNCKFDLTTFNLENGFGKNSERVNWNLTAFMSLHTESLRKVEISGPNCEHVNGFAIVNLKNLTSLTIDVRGLPKEPEFYEIIEQEQNHQLKELVLRGFFFQRHLIEKILTRFPGIEELELNDWSNSADLVDFVSENFPKLKNLSVTEISRGENAKFGVLNNLAVTYIRNSKKLLQFIARNPSVNSLKVGLVCIGHVTKDFVENLRNVEHLSFAGNGEVLKSILNLMEMKYRPESLKTLELSLISEPSNAKFSVNSGKSKKYFFPPTGTKQLVAF